MSDSSVSSLDGLWPTNVPPASDARLFLLGRTPPPPPLSLVTSDLASRLSPLEKSALGESSPLAEAVAMRWRLSAAIDLAPQGLPDESKDPLNVLLAEVDGVLERLRTVDVRMSPALSDAVDANRDALTRDAVALSKQGMAKDAPIVPHTYAPRPLAPEPRTSRKVVVHGSSGPVALFTRSRMIALGGVLALLVAGAYHLPAYFEDAPPLPSVPGAPPGLAVVPMPGQGVTLLRTATGRELDAVQRGWVDLQIHEKNLELKTLAPGQFMLAPARSAVAGGTR